MNVTPQWFWTKVQQPESCLLWTGRRNQDGYGIVYVPRPGRPGDSIGLPAHRVAYELFIGTIPDDLEIDHICHNRDLSCPGGATCPHRACVNPAHLEAVEGLVNIARGRVGVGSMGLTHCKRGHEYTLENTYSNKRGKRICRTCHRERMATVRSTPEGSQAKQLSDRRHRARRKEELLTESAA